MVERIPDLQMSVQAFRCMRRASARSLRPRGKWESARHIRTAALIREPPTVQGSHAPRRGFAGGASRIEQLDISDFNEAEVRANVIDPIVRILGYYKGTDFSVDLGRQIKILEKNRFPDYKFNLWDADFWLVEAKRPRHGEASFGYEDLAQALEYAAHPQINAALVVLCDGLKIEVFDREVDLAAPVLHIDRERLTQDFDKLRLLLDPWQVSSKRKPQSFNSSPFGNSRRPSSARSTIIQNCGLSAISARCAPPNL
jgi:hypothetical protein